MNHTDDPELPIMVTETDQCATCVHLMTTQACPLIRALVDGAVSINWPELSVDNCDMFTSAQTPNLTLLQGGIESDN